jgi:hypothetical protein
MPLTSITSLKSISDSSAILVLPELKVQQSLYTLFVYDEILMKQKASISWLFK